jgi:hypothetical protein
MQLSQLFTLTSISTAAALDTYFFCPYKTSGNCCIRFNPDTGTGDLCNPPFLLSLPILCSNTN